MADFSGWPHKPGAPRPAPVRVGVEIGVTAPPAEDRGVIGVGGNGALPPEGLRARDGDADYGFSPLRATETSQSEPRGGQPVSPWPNK